MKHALRWGIALVLVLTGLLGVGAYLATTESGLQALMRATAALSGGRLQVDGVQGRLAGRFGFRQVRIQRATQTLVLNDVQVDWLPRALLERRLEVALLSARSVQVSVTAPDDTPLQRPESLRLPLAVQVHVLDVGAIEYVDLSGERLALKSLRAALDGRGDHWRLDDVRVETPWAALSASFALGKDAPFALSGRIDAAPFPPLAVQARATLGGSLLAPRFALDAGDEAFTVLLRGEAAPFESVRLRHLLVAGEGLDPRRFAAEAPAADLAFSGVFEGRSGERLFGSFSLVNRAAGRLDQARLPLAALTGAVLGDATRADFSNLAMDLRGVGTLAGQGTWRDGQFALRLDGTRLNLAGVHRDLAATRLAAQLELSGDAVRQTLSGRVQESWGTGEFSVMHADRVLALTQARFTGAAGRLLAHGTLMLDTSRAFALNFEAGQINPARFGAFPRGRLNARGEASGALAPAFMLEARLNLPPGELEGRPVRGEARLRYADAHLSEAHADLDIAGNRMQADGAWGRTGDRLTWKLDAPALARLKLGVSGRLMSQGTLSGQPDTPSIDARFEAANLLFPGGVAAERLDATLNLVASERGAFEGRLDARGVRVSDWSLTRAQATLAGRQDAHTLALVIDRPDAQLRADLAGGLDRQRVWRGQLRTAELTGPWPVRLLAPASLVLSRDSQSVEALAVSFAGGRVELAELKRTASLLAVRGSATDMPLAPLAEQIDLPVSTRTDLVVSGDWNLTLGEQLSGVARLGRVRGDVRLQDPAMALGLTGLTATLRAAGGEADVSVDIVTRDAGQARLSAQLPLGIEAGVPVLRRGAALNWRARVDVPDLRLARPLLPVGIRLDARLTADLAGSGSLAAPEVKGQLRAERLRFAMPEEGIAVVDGVLELALSGDRVRVTRGELIGASGRIVVGGEAELRNPRAGLTLTFEQFSATQRSDRRVTVSGVAKLALAERRLKLSGDLVVDRARLEMPASNRPELSDDVIVIGRPPREAGVAQRYPLALDLTVALGNDFLFKGAGLDARLGGKLRVLTVDRALRGEGVIQVEKGRYAAYAQTLDIERGVLRFNGPLDNPGLDVLAVRKTPTVKAGVQVRGTVQRPVVTLYSDPAMPDTEKLSWLVLGHGLDSAGQQEFVLMQVAASALLNQAESVNFQARLAETLHIDSFDVRAGDSEDLGTAIVSVGKRLSSRATLSYEQSLDGLNQVVKVLYQLTPHVRLEARAGEQSSFDAFYTLEFD